MIRRKYKRQRYKRHYCTSLSDKKTVLWFPRQNDHYTHSLCDHCNEIIRTICVAAQTSLRLFFISWIAFCASSMNFLRSGLCSFFKWIFSFVGTFITGSLLKFSLGRFWRRWFATKKSRDIFMTFLKWYLF